MANEKYNTKGNLGTYPANAEPFPVPEGIKLFDGFGADDEDLRRGYCEPHVTEHPAYDKANYEERWTQPSHPTEDQENTQALPDDYEFRMRERKSRGFLTRPRIPTERN